MMNGVETANDRRSISQLVSQSVGQVSPRPVRIQKAKPQPNHTLLVPLLEIGETGR